MAWNPIIPGNFILPLALLCTSIGILAFIWLLFYIEHSRDLSRKDRIIGTLIRLIVMSITLGLGIFFFTRVDLI
ncbi:MAG: hypothetical protein ACXAC7_02290 [Candidatus Hodarchaeales archaeon]|jgi:uncharacterized metal-binding protein